MRTSITVERDDGEYLVEVEHDESERLVNPAPVLGLVVGWRHVPMLGIRHETARTELTEVLLDEDELARAEEAWVADAGKREADRRDYLEGFGATRSRLGGYL